MDINQNIVVMNELLKEIINEEKVITKQDFDNLFAMLMGLLGTTKQQLETQIATSQYKNISSVQSALKRVEKIEEVIMAYENRSLQTLRSFSSAILREVNKIDLSPLEQRITNIEENEKTAEDFINEINNLPIKRPFLIDKSHIAGLDEIEKLARKKHSTQYTGINGVKQIVAGAGITVDNSNLGYPVITATTTGFSTATETLTGTQSGLNVTLDLTGLSHTFTSVMFVTRNGQVINSTAWSRSTNTITVFNADASEAFQVCYNY